jgi:hypothetical protein
MVKHFCLRAVSQIRAGEGRSEFYVARINRENTAKRTSGIVLRFTPEVLNMIGWQIGDRFTANVSLDESRNSLWIVTKVDANSSEGMKMSAAGTAERLGVLRFTMPSDVVRELFPGFENGYYGKFSKMISEDSAEFSAQL